MHLPPLWPLYSLYTFLTLVSASTHATEILYTFPPTAFAENLISLPDGTLLLTTSSTPQLWAFNPLTSNASATPIAHIPGVNSLTGIVPLAHDRVAVLAGNESGEPFYAGTNGSWALWEVDYSHGLEHANASQIVAVEEALLLDGLAISDSPNVLLAGDTMAGSLWALDIHDRSATEILHDPALAGTNQSVEAGLAHLGINGLKYANGSALFTNGAKQTFGKIPIAESGKGAGAPVVEWNATFFLDDLLPLGGERYLITSETEGIVLLDVANKTRGPVSSVFAELSGANAVVRGKDALGRACLYACFQAETSSGVARIVL